MRDDRRGSVLVEVLVALVLLAVGGVALVTLLGQTSRTMRAAHDTERDTRAASRVLARVASMRRAELVAAIGTTTIGMLRVQVGPRSPDLFDVDVSLSDTTPVLLRTTLYRPASSDGRAP